VVSNVPSLKSRRSVDRIQKQTLAKPYRKRGKRSQMSPESGSDLRREYLRRLPSIGKLMEHPKLLSISGKYPRVLLVKAIQNAVEVRKEIILAARDEDEIKDMNLSSEKILQVFRRWLSFRCPEFLS